MSRAVVAGVLGAAACAVAGGAALAASATPKPVVAHDAKGDVRSPLDLTRLSVARGADGRVRASLTLAAAWADDALAAKSGPPGSVCLKVWAAVQPPDAPPDYLVCATTDAHGKLRGSVLHERPSRLPERVAGAEVTRPSRRTVTLRFAQSAVGGPKAVDVAGETSRPGCPRVSCVDTAPDAPAALHLALRD